MNELEAVLSARKLLASLQPISLPVPVERYAAAVNAVIRYPDDMESDEPGFSFEGKGRWNICINPNDTPGRQRFTACHEVAHIRLGVPSAHHKATPAWNFAKKSNNELICDRFASELLLPHQILRPHIERMAIGIKGLQDLASHFEASLTATCSAFVTLASAPCALVVSHAGRIHYALCSTALRGIGGWISAGGALPQQSISAYVRTGKKSEGPETAEPDEWFKEWKREGGLLEDAIHFSEWDQTVTLLWFEDEELPPPQQNRRDLNRDEEDEMGLAPLDGNLPWPDKSRSRK